MSDLPEFLPEAPESGTRKSFWGHLRDLRTALVRSAIAIGLALVVCLLIGDKLVAILAVVSMAIIFYIGVQPPNDWALEITLGFLVLTAIVWFGFENRRFQGPPIGDAIAKRKEQIAAAEAAVGEA